MRHLLIDIKPDWNHIRPILQARTGRSYPDGYLAEVWKGRRANSKVLAILEEVFGSREEVEAKAAAAIKAAK